MSPAKIKKIRIKLGLTQAQLAETIGVAKLTLSQYETGFRNPSKTVIILLMVLDGLSRKETVEFLDLLKLNAVKLKRDGHG
jgi:transcriptional regulator with XRE-family HTH domain